MDSKKRSWVKSVTWRLLGIVILGAISYLLTSDWRKMTGITVLFHTIRMLLYYTHERIWERIPWGKVHHPLAQFTVKENLTRKDYEAIRKFLHSQDYLGKPPEYQI